MTTTSRSVVITLLCVLVLLILCVSALKQPQENARSPFPSIGQKRSIERLLGPSGSNPYNFTNQIKRTLSTDDVSSVLFQEHKELQGPYRLQLILSHQKRVEMLSRVLYTDDALLTPFILPSLLSYQEYTSTPSHEQTESTYNQFKNLYSGDDLLVLDLLQSLQQSFLKETLLNDYTRENQQELIKTLKNTAMSPVDQYKAHITSLFSDIVTDTTALFNALTENIGDRSPLINVHNSLLTLAKNKDNFMKAIDSDEIFRSMPILLIELPLNIVDNKENRSILNRFAQHNNQNRDYSVLIAYINDQIRQIILKSSKNPEKHWERTVLTTNILETSKKLLHSSLTSFGSRNYIYGAAEYNFYLHLLTQTTDKAQTVYNPQMINKVSITHSVPQYFQWDSYDIPLAVPSSLTSLRAATGNDEYTLNAVVTSEETLKNGSSGVQVVLTYPQQFYTYSLQEELYLGYNINVHDVLQQSLRKKLMKNPQMKQALSQLSAASIDDIVINIKNYKYNILVNNYQRFINNENNRVTPLVQERMLSLLSLQLKQGHSFSDDQYTLYKALSTNLMTPQEANLEAPHHFNFLNNWLYYYDYSSFLIENAHALSLTNLSIQISSPATEMFLKTLQNTENDKNTNINPVSLLRDEVTCSACKESEQRQYDAMRESLPDFLQKNLDGLCRTVWPAIAPYFGENLCDPAIPNECYYLCTGMVNVYKDSVSDILSFLFHSPEKQCFKQKQCDFNPDDQIPAFPTQTLIPQAGDASVLRKIFHITDIHFDAKYSQEQGSRVVCKMPVCCHKIDNTTVISDMNYNTFNIHSEMLYESLKNGNNNEEDSEFFHFAQTHREPSVTERFSLISQRQDVPRPMGEYLCDTPELLMQSSVEQILVSCPDYVVYTGDSPAHDLWEQTMDANLHAIHTVNNILELYANKCAQFYQQRMRGVAPPPPMDDIDLEMQSRYEVLFNALTPEQQKQLSQDDLRRDSNIKPSFAPVLGNHAYAPVNHYAGFGHYDDWLLKPLAEQWASFLDSDAVKTVRFGGFYVKSVHANTYIIGLHTGLLDQHNPWRILNLGFWDPSGQFHWLENILGQIERLGGKAIMIMHEPHGDIINSPAKDYMLSLYVKYKKTIINALAGHEHHDFTRLIHNNFPINITGTYFDQLQYLAPLQFNLDLEQNIRKTRDLFSEKSHLLQSTPYMLYSHKLRVSGDHYNTKLHFYLDTISSLLSSQRNQIPLTMNPMWQLEPILLELLPSSITPVDYSTNPAFRVLDLQNNVFTNYRQYVFDIMVQDTTVTKSNFNQTTAIWKEMYNFLGLYKKYDFNANLVTAEVWHGIVSSVYRRDKADRSAAALWNDYTALYWGFVPENVDPLQPTRWDRNTFFCSIFTHVAEEFNYCMQHLDDY